MNPNPIFLKASSLMLACGMACGTALALADTQPGAPSAFALQSTASSAPSAPADAQSFSGKVVETMNAAGYTYVLVDTGKQKQWAAAPQFQVKVGDTLMVGEGMPMRNYHSKSLNRDFDVVYFTGRVQVNGSQVNGAVPATSLPQGHPSIASSSAPASKVDLSGIKKAEGGKTIQEIYASKTQLAGKQVKVRGKVVKYNPMIMGKNWIHLQDGTGSEGSNDLTLTTLAPAKVGDTVVATGAIALDKDFGYGYKYNVIMEDAKLTPEPATVKK